MHVDIRCPACAATFEVAEERLGRNVYCLECGARMTSRPVEVERALRRRPPLAPRPGAAPGRLPLVALLDNVRSLWNVGAIFRTADAFGIGELALTGITGCPPQPRIAKTALGAERAVGWRYEADPLVALRALQAAGYRPVALEATPRAVDLPEFRWPARPCLVVGNEVAGVSWPVLEACDAHVRVPMRGSKDSLNVAVAFGVAAWAASRAVAARESAGDAAPAAGTPGGTR